MRASRGISIHTGMAFLRNEFYNMSETVRKSL